MNFSTRIMHLLWSLFHDYMIATIVTRIRALCKKIYLFIYYYYFFTSTTQSSIKLGYWNGLQYILLEMDWKIIVMHVLTEGKNHCHPHVSLLQAVHWNQVIVLIFLPNMVMIVLWIFTFLICVIFYQLLIW